MAKGDGKYKWGTGGRVHKIPLATHKQNVQAKRALGTLDLTAPPSAPQAVQEANSAADLQFGPQVQMARQAQTNVGPWFADHMARVAGYAQAARELNAPVLAQAQAYQQGAAAQTPPGLDANSAAGQQATQAAQGRQALAQLGLDALNANATATQDYFGGQQNVVSRMQPQVQAGADQELAFQQGQRGAKVEEFLTGARQNAQNYAIARGTLGLNDAKAQADAANDAAAITQSAADKRAQRAVTRRGQDIGRQNAQDRTAAGGAKPNQYGVPQEQWERWSTSHRQRVMEAYNEKHATGADQEKAEKHAADVHAASGRIENTVTDIIGKWDSYVGKETDDTTKPIMKDGKPVKGPDGKPTYESKKLSPEDIRAILGQDKKLTPQLIHIALLRRAKKKLDQASIDYLHNLDPNFRIPRDWLPYDPSIRAGSPQDPKSGAGNK